MVEDCAMTDIASVRARLCARRDELAERVRRIDTGLRHRDEPMPADFAEQAVAQENLEVLYSLEAEGRAELARVERALARLEHGDYTTCSRCGAEIAPARLAALPYAETCIRCAD
jgi:RNA polymerase-binding transcription factor DksA